MKNSNVFNFILTICVCEGTEQVERASDKLEALFFIWRKRNVAHGKNTKS